MAYLFKLPQFISHAHNPALLHLLRCKRIGLEPQDQGSAYNRRQLEDNKFSFPLFDKASPRIHTLLQKLDTVLCKFCSQAGNSIQELQYSGFWCSWLELFGLETGKALPLYLSVKMLDRETLPESQTSNAEEHTSNNQSRLYKLYKVPTRPETQSHRFGAVSSKRSAPQLFSSAIPALHHSRQSPPVKTWRVPSPAGSTPIRLVPQAYLDPSRLEF